MTEPVSHGAAAGQQDGRVDLLIEQRDGISRPIRSLAAPPLQLSRVRYDHGPATACFTLLQLGGMLSGDSNHIALSIGPGAQAEVVGAAATQVLAMPHGSAGQHIEATLAEASQLQWLPEATILFAEAAFTQTARIVLHPDALLAWLDVLVPGRLARGEQYTFRRYANRLGVCNPAGRVLLAERALLEPGRHTLAVGGMFGDTPVVGSLWLLGTPFDARCAAQVGESGDPSLGATTLPNGCGVLLRAVGPSSSAVRGVLLGWLRRLWQPNP